MKHPLNTNKLLKGTGTYNGKAIKQDAYRIVLDVIESKIHVLVLGDTEHSLVYDTLHDFLLEWKNVNVYDKLVSIVPEYFSKLYKSITAHR